MRVPCATPDIRRDHIPHHLVLQSNASQGHEDVSGCINQLLLTFMWNQRWE